jgi:hypothetical protein
MGVKAQRDVMLSSGRWVAKLRRRVSKLREMECFREMGDLNRLRWMGGQAQEDGWPYSGR